MKPAVILATLALSTSIFAAPPSTVFHGSTKIKSGVKGAGTKSFENEPILSRPGSHTVIKELSASLKKVNEENIASIKARQREVPASLKCLNDHMEEFVSQGAHGSFAIGPNDTGLSPAEIRRVLTEISNGGRSLSNYDE
jgi:hypothetical protein